MTSKPRKTFPNLRNGEKQALNELKKNKNITIKPADKGGAVVVLNTSDYIAECTKQLSNITHYQPLSANPSINIIKSSQRHSNRVLGTGKSPQKSLKHSLHSILHQEDFTSSLKYTKKGTLEDLL
ncbi:hypothetical protein ElyMa_004366400 [Elysia marginata]|uniref:Uncharacterized protein n=1 Tax=Elysia marginata TaxID=1093978 RepID=A0AAV4H435_9GAST|nr:hypothetical protein ElyMa_004366400 [Elysia marginata]